MSDQQIVKTRTLSVVRSWGLAAALLIVAGGVYFAYDCCLSNRVSLAALSQAKDSLGQYVQTNIVLVFLAAVLAYAVVTSILLPTVVWLTLLISYSFGAAFGVWLGACLASLAIYFGVLCGLPVAFLAVRFIVGDALRDRFGATIDQIARGVERDALFFIIALRLIPIVPYMVVNAAPALVRVKLSTHLVASAIGLIPGTFVYSYLGASLTTAVDATSIQVSWQILLALAGLGALSLLPIGLRRFAPQLMGIDND